MAFFKNLWTFLTETIFLKDERNYRNGLIRWGVRQYKLLFYTARGSTNTTRWCAVRR